MRLAPAQEEVQTQRGRARAPGRHCAGGDRGGSRKSPATSESRLAPVRVNAEVKPAILMQTRAKWSDTVPRLAPISLAGHQDGDNHGAFVHTRDAPDMVPGWTERSRYAPKANTSSLRSWRGSGRGSRSTSPGFRSDNDSKSGLNRSSQHLDHGGCDAHVKREVSPTPVAARRHGAADRTLRPAMRSPGQLQHTRAVQRQFWRLIARSLSTEGAALVVSVSTPVASEWSRHATRCLRSVSMSPPADTCRQRR